MSKVKELMAFAGPLASGYVVCHKSGYHLLNAAKELLGPDATVSLASNNASACIVQVENAFSGILAAICDEAINYLQGKSNIASTGLYILLAHEYPDYKERFVKDDLYLFTDPSTLYKGLNLFEEAIKKFEHLETEGVGLTTGFYHAVLRSFSEMRMPEELIEEALRSTDFIGSIVKCLNEYPVPLDSYLMSVLPINYSLESLKSDVNELNETVKYMSEGSGAIN